MKSFVNRGVQRLLPGLLLVVFALSLSACGSKGPTVVHLKLTEYAITMDKTSVPAGPIKFEIQNMGTIAHEVVIEPNGANDKAFELNGIAAEARDIAPGKSATLDWTLDQPGTYQLGCHTPGHYEKGMFTTFEVTAP